MKVNALKENLSGTTAQLEAIKGELTSLKEEKKLLKEGKLEKEDEALVEKQSDTKLKVMYNIVTL